jgi:4-amino-4-deoxy-L-arabinose transferase-like glycosyltransferase
VLIVLVGGLLRARSLSGPFGFGWQHLGAHYGNVARNYLRYGPRETRFAMVQNAEPAPREQWVYFTHHPPGMGLTTAAAFLLFGDSPFSMRLMGWLASLLQIVAIAYLVRTALSPEAGLAAAAATSLLPAGAYYATHGSDLGPQVLALSLCALWADQKARARHPERPPCVAVLLWLAAAAFFDWPALLLAGALGLRDLVARRWRRFFCFFAFSLAVPTLHFLQVRWATGSTGGGRGGTLWESFLEHGVLGAAKIREQLPLAEIPAQLWQHLGTLYTAPGALLAGLGLLCWLCARSWLPRPGRGAGALFVALLILALGYTVPFPRAVLIHEFWMIVSLPLVSLALGGLIHLTRSRRLVHAAILLLVSATLGYGVVDTWKRQNRDRTPYFKEFGTILRQRTRPGEPILTPEKASACLRYHAAAQSMLLEYLPSQFEVEKVDLPRTGTTLWLFDLSKKRLRER